jgi:hypothetical protein
MSGSWFRKMFGNPRTEIVQAIKDFENSPGQDQREKVLNLINNINPNEEFCTTKFLDTHTQKTLMDRVIQTMDIDIASAAIDKFIVINNGNPTSKSCGVKGENNPIKTAFDRLMIHINVTNSSDEETFVEYDKLLKQEKEFRQKICEKYKIEIPYSRGGARKRKTRKRKTRNRNH